MSAACRCAQARQWLQILLVCLLGGCSLLPWMGQDESGTEQAFELMGRISVRHDGRAITGQLRWQHAVARDEVWLASPLGDVIAHIVRENSGATLTTANRQVYRAGTVAALTREGLGWVFPLVDLGYYVQGESSPVRAPRQVEHGPDGRITRIVTEAWDIELTATQQNPRRPQRLRLVSPEVEIRLVVDRLDVE